MLEEEQDIIKEASNKKLLIIWILVSGIFFVSSLGLILWASALMKGPEARNMDFLRGLSNKLTKNNPTDNDQEKPELYERLIDGVMVEKSLVDRRPLAVIMDNHLLARPQSSLAKANLVIEAEAEGGITRFLAFYAEPENENIKKIGPVRSVRPYFIDWAKEYSALLAHVGGSPAALAKLEKENTFHINEFYNEKYFWRDDIRTAPHNVYTSPELLEKYITEKNITYPGFFPLLFKDDIETSVRPAASEININYFLADFWVTWKYDRENNNYIRYQAAEAAIDEQNEVITAKNIVIQKIPAEETDDELRIKMQHIGEGEAIVCRDGTCLEGLWKKRSETSRTRYYDRGNKEIKFNRGKTWIEVVRPGYNIDF